MSRLQELYARLPVPLQHLAVSAYGVWWRWLRLGPGFPAYCQEYRERESWSRDRWEEWRRQRLAAVLGAAAEHVPYYRERWTPPLKSAAAAGRLGALPVLRKAEVRRRPDAFVDERLRRRARWRQYTSGTTGTPITTYWTTEEVRRSVAVREVRSLGWAGVSLRMPRATLSARVVVGDRDRDGTVYRYNRAERQVYLSVYHLAEDTAADYLEAMRRHGSRWLIGFPVAIHLLARFTLKLRLEPPPLEAIVCISEKLTDSMRTTIAEAFRAPVHEEYGAVEHVFLATACEEGRLHVSPDVGVVELLDENDRPVPAGRTGRVVATGLSRTSQPLIRYDTGDLATSATEACPCGRRLPVIQAVEGRHEELVRLPDGRQLVRFDVLFKGIQSIVEAQVVQEAPTRLRIRVVADDEFGAPQGELLRRRVHERLGSDIRVTIDRVDRIERTAAGKFRAVVSKLDDAASAGGDVA